MITYSMEDYLRALFILEERNMALSITNIAQYLKVSKPSVHGMMKTLDNKKFIIFQKYSKIEFTKKGKKLAIELTAKHRIIETFLTDTLKVNIKDVHKEANMLEHGFSSNVFIKLKKFLGNPILDPHGRKIPNGK